MAAESRLQTKIISDLKKSGWLVNKIMLCSMTGWPDIFAIKKTKVPKTPRCLLIEVKAKGKKATALQKHVHGEIEKQDGEVHVIDSWDAYLNLKYSTL